MLHKLITDAYWFCTDFMINISNLLGLTYPGKQFHPVPGDLPAADAVSHIPGILPGHCPVPAEKNASVRFSTGTSDVPKDT